jgi:SAM-dependent methyltransferase
MNRDHMEFCTSAAWREILEDQILPNAFALASLGPDLIEVGPGPGFTTEALLKSAHHVTAVEIDPVLAEELKSRLFDVNVDVVIGDARASGLESDSCTGGASFHMLHHVPTDEEQDEIFAELFRVIRCGGMLLLADGFDSDAVRTFHEGDNYNPIDTGTLSERLTRVGFSDIRIEPHDLGWYCTAVVQ